MISPFLMIPWLFGRKRKPLPEYTSPNSWVAWHGANNEVLELQARLIETFNQKQNKIYFKLREKALEVDRRKPWQYELIEGKK